jgi:hypothetical protein
MQLLSCIRTLQAAVIVLLKESEPMRKPLLKTTLALGILMLLAHLALVAVPQVALAQPDRPTLTPTPPPAPTREPAPQPTEPPTAIPTEPPTAEPATPEPPTPTLVPTPTPAALPVTSGSPTDWSAALGVLAVLLLGAGGLVRFQTYRHSK